jgi:hypothetical protein
MDRWDEELRIVSKEMGWTVRGFVFYAKRWRLFKNNALQHPEKREYAAKQEAMWMGKAKAAVKCFASENIDLAHIIV